jgi:Zn-dependent protease with chaperone function
MLFFESQRKAKEKTTWFLILFIINTILISALNVGLVKVFHHAQMNEMKLVFVGSIFFFVGMSFFFNLTIPKGKTLIEKMGGRILSNSSNDLKEKQLINIVAEMALASGVGIPACAIIDETSINAFVVGEDLSEVFVVVTAGALEVLTRDELQAVIGHEFSHILNEDIALNSKLAGVVKGFQFIAKMGDFFSGDRRRFGNSYSSSRTRTELSLIGMGLFAIGYLGFLLGKMIQSFVSKQREYLADASAAQFTRNPEALARALGKILLGNGSSVGANSSREFAHIFFADPSGSTFMSWLFATHPPLRDRIQKLAPHRRLEDILSEAQEKGTVPTNPTSRIHDVDVKKILNCIGTPADENFQAASLLMTGLNPLTDLLHNIETARAAVTLVALRSQENALEEGIRQLNENSKIKSDLIELQKATTRGEKERVALFKVALTSLKELPLKDKQELIEKMRELFELDKKWTLLEALLFLVARKILLPGLAKPKAPKLGKELAKQWFLQDENVNFQEFESFLNGWDQVTLLEKKGLIEELFNGIDVAAEKTREEFRLFCLWLGVPVPQV